MLTDYIEEFERGVSHGMDNALRVTLQDPAFKSEKPDDIKHPVVFAVGQRCAEAGGGALSFYMFDLCTLGLLPLYNYYKNRDNTE